MSKEKQIEFINIAFTEAEHKRVKKYCKKHDLTMREYIRRAEEYYWHNFAKNQEN